MQQIGELLKEKNIELDTDNAVLREGFTQIPNFILRNPTFSPGAKNVYGLFLSYAWHDDFCFPGQDRLAEDMGMSRSRVTEFVGELQKGGLITIKRRGQGNTNFYTIHFKVKPKKGQAQGPVDKDIQKSAGRHLEVGGLTSSRQPADFTLYKNIQKKNIQIQGNF